MVLPSFPSSPRQTLFHLPLIRYLGRITLLAPIHHTSSYKLNTVPAYTAWSCDCTFSLFSLQTALYPFVLQVDKMVLPFQVQEYSNFFKYRVKWKITLNDCFNLYLRLRYAILWCTNKKYVRIQKLQVLPAAHCNKAFISDCIQPPSVVTVQPDSCHWWGDLLSNPC